MKITNKLKLALKSLLELQLGEVATDKANLIFDGELAEGIEVFVKDENGELIPAEDGDYKAEDGKVISIAEGKVAKIAEPEPQISEDELKFNEQKVEMSVSYDEITRNIQKAVEATGVNGYVESAGVDFAVINIWTNEGCIHYRYTITTNEDGTVVLGDREEVKPDFVPVQTNMADEPKPEEKPVDEQEPEVQSADERITTLETKVADIVSGIEKVLNSVSALEGRITELEEKIAKLDTTPAEKPIDETHEEEVKQTKMSYLKK